eukprot:3793612-Pleurochrysis_carterae.AAC.1
MARQRPHAATDDGLGGRVVTRHSYRPPLRAKGSVRRDPSSVGGPTMVSVSPKRQLEEDDSHSWFTDSSESEKEGTHRTSRRVRSIDKPRASLARK